ncbi:MAG TPA: alpha-L-arabinofuranosidase C-terminal domain-containing protein [Paenibacillus sp.]|uniref:alpha-N-arabinofuranosidase n=1 Tax=Paenibacillus sp. TaxID=58172 RepID=UPI002BBCF535|nr:alpha-L-arabinofuranosidase C-terminal domain-containing protein [Paenibacillus sp.]HUC94063.1 alpha-L-arabinofuranosidase C-terminal domain-containing protein [Paenibacillus sp.]
MKTASYIADKTFRIGEVDKRLFSSFIEHLGRNVYGGLYEPGHPDADEQGFRKDVMALIKELGIPMIRYPGGNFVSGYDWVDGIGPVKDRPSRLDLAWRVTETNEIGTDEFADWARKTGVDFMAAVNLGTGTPKEAGQLIEYCNHPSGTYWSDLRRKNGHESPHGIKTWCLGNEMDGPWQIGALSPDDYGKKALETAKIMRWVDPDIELVVVGSSTPEMPGYPDWDRIVLEHTYEYADYISIHRYYSYDAERPLFFPIVDVVDDFPYFAVDMNEFIRTVVAAVDLTKAKKRSRKQVHVSFDEWGVVSSSTPREVREPWEVSSSVTEGESTFNLLDALIYGGLLCTLLKNADRVKIACQSLLINAGGMISTKKNGPVIKQTTFYPFQQVSQYGRGVSLRDRLDAPSVETPHYGSVPALQSAAVYNEETNSVTVFMVNCDRKDDILTSFDLRSFGNVRLIEHRSLGGDDLFATNTYDHPECVVPQPVPTGSGDEALIPKSSWNMLRFACE